MKGLGGIWRGKHSLVGFVWGCYLFKRGHEAEVGGWGGEGSGKNLGERKNTPWKVWNVKLIRERVRDQWALVWKIFKEWMIVCRCLLPQLWDCMFSLLYRITPPPWPKSPEMNKDMQLFRDCLVFVLFFSSNLPVQFFKTHRYSSQTVKTSITFI